MLCNAIHSMLYTQMVSAVQITAAASTNLHWISKHGLLALKNVSLFLIVHTDVMPYYLFIYRMYTIIKRVKMSSCFLF